MQHFESGQIVLPPQMPLTQAKLPPSAPAGDPFPVVHPLNYASRGTRYGDSNVEIPWWKHGLVALLLLFIVGTSFSNSYQAGMTLDNKYIIEEYYKSVLRNNPDLDPKSWQQVWLIFKNDYWWPKGISGLYRPLTTLSYWFDYVILTGKAPKTDQHGQVYEMVNGKPIEELTWGEYSSIPYKLKTTSYHTINLTIHWINAILIYFVALKLTRKIWVSLLIAGLFAAHPITTESVTNIIGRADLFSATAVFGGLLIYMRAREHSDSRALPWLVGLALMTAFGVFSKESSAAMVLVIICYDVAYNWRLDETRESSILRVLARGTPFFLGMTVITLITSVITDVHEPLNALSYNLRLGVAGILTAIGVAQYAGVVIGKLGWTARYISAGAALLIFVIATLFIPYAPMLGIFAIVGFEILYRMIVAAQEKKLAELPLLILHGMSYLLLVGVLLGVPLVASKYVRDHEPLKDLPQMLRVIGALVLALAAAGAYAVTARMGRVVRILTLAGAAVAITLACLLMPIYPLVAALIIVAIELARGSLTSENPRFKVVAHAALYLPLFFGLIAVPIAALYFFHEMGWDKVAPSYDPNALRRPITALADWLSPWLRVPMALIAVAAGLFLHLISIRADRTSRSIALVAVAIISMIASFYSYWLGIALMLVVALHEVILGTLTPQLTDQYRRDWKTIWHRFAVGYLAMLPAVIAMFAVRAWVFANATPAEEPFLDNPIRGVWKVAELNLPSFAEQIKLKPILGMSFFECKMTAVKILGKLLLLLTWPHPLCSDYSYAQIPNFSYTFRQGWDDVQAVLALVVLLGIFYLAYKLYTRSRAAFFFIIFFFAAGLPTSNIVLTIGSVMAERFMYLPLAGFTACVVLGAYALFKKLFQWLNLYDQDDFPWYSIIPGVLLSFVIVVYGILTYVRNPVWTSDRTLWEDAILTSPKAFRCYQSLAFALYEDGLYDGVPARHVDRMIALDEQGIQIVKVLPDQLNSSRMYMHLGMYYQLKADTLTYQQGPNLVVTAEAMKFYKKSADILEEGITVDRSFNELNRKKQKLRGDPDDEINDAGLGPIYGTVAMAYSRLGQLNPALIDVALHRLEYARQLDPNDPDNYARMGLIAMQKKDWQKACQGLIQSILLDPKRRDVWDSLRRAYAERGPNSAIMVELDGTPKLNTADPMLHDDFLEVYKDFIRVFLRAHRYIAAEDARRSAIQTYGFLPEIIDGLFEEPIWAVTPDGIDPDPAHASPPHSLRKAKGGSARPAND